MISTIRIMMISTHPEERITIEDLAHKYLMNPTTLKDVFKAVYGESIASHMWVFRVGFCYLWVLKMGGGLLSIWMGMYLDWAFRSICFMVRFVRGKWLEQKVI